MTTDAPDIETEQNGNGNGNGSPELPEPIQERLQNMISEAIGEAEIRPVTIYVRDKTQARRDVSPTTAAPEPAIRSALETPGTWIEWPGCIKEMAMLDVDFHGVDVPRWVSIETRILALAARPLCYWRSHGGGAHAIFVPLDGYDADELAACAAVDMAGSYECRDAKFEVIARSRHPGSVRGEKTAGPVTWIKPVILGDVIRSWSRSESRDVTPEEIVEYRQAKGWGNARDVPHDQCPFDPAHKSNSPRPVFLAPSGISCQSCKGRGLRSFAPWAEILDGTTRPNPTKVMASALVDWSHAELVLAEEFGDQLAAQDLRRAYFALCKFIHGDDDPRVRSLARNKDGDFVRGVGCWLDPINLRPVNLGKVYFQGLPYCRYVTRAPGPAGDTITTGLDQTAVERANNSGPLPGWPEILPVRGAKVWGSFNSYPSMPGAHRVSVIDPDQAAEPPRYVPTGSRMDIDQAWAELGRRFPGISRNYVELLLVARGFAESGGGRVPRVMVTGPSGSAKSTTVRVASSIVGDVTRAIPYTRNFRERFDSAVTEAGFILCDEFAKPPRAKTRGRKQEGPGFEFFLDMEDRTYSARLMYIGPISLRLDSVVIITGTGFPPELLGDVQVGRRFVHVGLTQRTPDRWEKTCGFSDVGNLRRFLPDVCDAVLSDVMDRFFFDLEPGTATFDAAAKSLGFGTVEDAQDDDQEHEGGIDPFSSIGLIRTFFELVCSGEGCTPPPGRWKARGRRRFGLFDESEIAKIWRELADDVAEVGGKHRSEKVDEQDLVLALGFERQEGVQIKLEVRGDFRTVCVRFVTKGPGPSLINEEIQDAFKRGGN